jgi:threonyl-tRNA synthetase
MRGHITALLQQVYRDFGFTEIVYKVATRPPQRIGADESWDRAEGRFAGIVAALGLPVPNQSRRGRLLWARRSSTT